MLRDLSSLPWQQFELLCAALLKAEGYNNVVHIGEYGIPNGGVDITFDSPAGEKWIGIVKYYRKSLTSPILLKQLVVSLERAISFAKIENALLILSVPIEESLREYVIGEQKSIKIWDGSDINNLLNKHSGISEQFFRIVEAQAVLQNQTAQNRRDAPGEEILRRLNLIQPGRDQWKEYEEVCVDALNYLFSPPLRIPKIQSRTHDGLDRRDAIYPIGFGSAFWEDIKYSHSSRMVVVEFKNHTDPVGQAEVESLAQYLLPKARRSFGLLCSRKPPSKPALTARRRAWMVAENIILFISDGDLTQMLQIKDQGGNPEELLDIQLDEFFIELAP